MPGNDLIEGLLNDPSPGLENNKTIYIYTHIKIEPKVCLQAIYICKSQHISPFFPQVDYIHPVGSNVCIKRTQRERKILFAQVHSQNVYTIKA